MKKEIKYLINSKDGVLKINKYSRLVRYTEDALGDPVDVLKIEFSIHNSFDYTKSIKSRDWVEIVEEIKIATSEAFDKARDEYIKEISNGYIG